MKGRRDGCEAPPGRRKRLRARPGDAVRAGDAERDGARAAKRLLVLFLALTTWAGVVLQDADPAHAQNGDEDDGAEGGADGADPSGEEGPDTPADEGEDPEADGADSETGEGEDPEAEEAEGTAGDNYYPCPSGQDIDVLAMIDASGSLNQRGGIDPDGTHRRAALETLRGIFTGELDDDDDPGADSTDADDNPGADSTDADSTDTGESDGSSDAPDAPEVRLALFYFHSEAAAVTGFTPMDDSHPSEQDIRTTLQLGQVRGRNTNYDSALEKVIEAFAETDEDGSGRDKCRILLFFTDGIYDPDGRVGSRARLTEDATTELTDRLRQRVCVGEIPADDEAPDAADPADTGSSSTESIVGRFRGLGIQTFAVVLGETFVEALEVAEGGNDRTRRIASASLQALRALTSDPTTQFDEQVPDHPDCEAQDEQHGQIITLRDIGDLEITLVEVVETVAAESTMLRWQHCSAEQPETGSLQSSALPAGRFIETIAIYPSGGTITEYRLQGIEGSDWQTAAYQTRLVLDRDPDLLNLEAGWTLEVKLKPRRGYTAEEVTLACYVAPAETRFKPLEFEIQTTSGESADTIYVTPDDNNQTPDYDTGYRLIATQEDGRHPDEICGLSLESARTFDLLTQTIVDLDLSRCAQGGYPQIANYQPDCQDTPPPESQRSMDVVLKPTHISSMFTDEDAQFVVPATIAHIPEILCPEAPLLSDCQAELDITNRDDEVPEEPLNGEIECILKLPSDGEMRIRSSWIPGPTALLPGPFGWQLNEVRFGNGITLTPSDSVNVHQGTIAAKLDVGQSEITIDSALLEQPEIAGSLDISNSLPLHLNYVTDDVLDETREWKVVGQFDLRQEWQPDSPLYSDNQSIDMSDPEPEFIVSAAFLAHSSLSWTWIITLTVVAVSFIFSYLQLCWVLRWHITLPDPRDFWAHYVPLSISSDSDRERLSVEASGPDGMPLGPPIVLRVATQKGRCFTGVSATSPTGERLLISVKRAAFLNLPGLLRDVQATISTASRFAAANLKGSRPSTTQKVFSQLTVVEAQPDRSGETVRCAAWFLEPRKGPAAGRTHAPISEVQGIVDALAVEIAKSPALEEEEQPPEEEVQPEDEPEPEPAKPAAAEKKTALPSAQAPPAPGEGMPPPKTPFGQKTPFGPPGRPPGPPGKRQNAGRPPKPPGPRRNTERRE